MAIRLKGPGMCSGYQLRCHNQECIICEVMPTKLEGIEDMGNFHQQSIVQLPDDHKMSSMDNSHFVLANVSKMVTTIKGVTAIDLTPTK